MPKDRIVQFLIDNPDRNLSPTIAADLVMIEGTLGSLAEYYEEADRFECADELWELVKRVENLYYRLEDAEKANAAAKDKNAVQL